MYPRSPAPEPKPGAPRKEPLGPASSSVGAPTVDWDREWESKNPPPLPPGRPPPVIEGASEPVSDGAYPRALLDIGPNAPGEPFDIEFNESRRTPIDIGSCPPRGRELDPGAPPPGWFKDRDDRGGQLIPADGFLPPEDKEYGMDNTAALTPDNSIGRFPGRSQASLLGSYA